MNPQKGMKRRITILLHPRFVCISTKEEEEEDYLKEGSIVHIKENHFVVIINMKLSFSYSLQLENLTYSYLPNMRKHILV